MKKENSLTHHSVPHPAWFQLLEHLLGKYQVKILNVSTVHKSLSLHLQKQNDTLIVEVKKLSTNQVFFSKTKQFSITHSTAERLNTEQHKILSLFHLILAKVEERVPTDLELPPYSFRGNSQSSENNFFFCTVEECMDSSGNSSHEAMIRLTSHCNQRCPFCSGERFFRAPSDKEIRQCMTKLIEKYDNLTTTLTGGEPTLSPAFVETVRTLAADDRVTDISIQTNGVTFAQTSLLKKMVQSDKIRFFISFHGSNKKLYDKCTGTTGQFPLAVEGIKNIISRGNRVFLNCVISNINFQSLDHYLEDLTVLFGKELPEIHFSTLICSEYNADASNYLVRYTEVAQKLSLIYEQAKQEGLQLSPQQSSTHASIPYCFSSEKLRKENSKFTDIGNDDIGYGADEKRWMKAVDCKKCIYDHVCLGLPREYVKKFNYSELVPICKQRSGSIVSHTGNN